MKAALLSDVHIDGVDDPALERFVRFCQEVQAEQLFILGDLFHAGWGYPGPAEPAHERAIGALQALIGRGVAVVFVPGNHDFAMSDYLVERVGLSVSARWEGHIAGHRTVLIHGDEADGQLGYRAMSWLLRGPLFAGLMGLLGPARGRALIHEMAGSSRAHGDKVAPAWLREAQLELADRLLEGETELVVMGHSHHGELVRRPGGVFVNTGDFGRAGTWLAVGESLELRTGMP